MIAPGWANVRLISTHHVPRPAPLKSDGGRMSIDAHGVGAPIAQPCGERRAVRAV